MLENKFEPKNKIQNAKEMQNAKENPFTKLEATP